MSHSREPFGGPFCVLGDKEVADMLQKSPNLVNDALDDDGMRALQASLSPLRTNMLEMCGENAVGKSRRSRAAPGTWKSSNICSRSALVSASQRINLANSDSNFDRSGWRRVSRL